MAKKINRFGYAIVSDMMIITRPTGFDRNKIEEEWTIVHLPCPTCAQSGQPTDPKNISSTKIYEAFKE